MGSRLHQNAVIRSLEVIGEAAGKVSPEFRAAQADISWREMIGLRHRLIHGYADVRLDLVWRVVTEHLDPLLLALGKLVLDESARDA
jgi:uncharacterized protein with HEPN domain